MAEIVASIGCSAVVSVEEGAVRFVEWYRVYFNFIGRSGSCQYDQSGFAFRRFAFFVW